MTYQSASIKRRTIVAIFSTVILSSILTFSRPAKAFDFFPNCTTSQLVSAVSLANNNVEKDVIWLRSTCRYVTNATLPVLPDNTNGVVHKLVIQGRGDGAIISPSGTFRLFNVQANANVVFKNVTLANGRGASSSGLSSAAGGAIYIAPGATVRLEDSRVAGNNAGPGSIGGGIFNRGVLRVLDSTLADNGIATAGGAIANEGTLTVAGTRFFRNSGEGGGAIANTAKGTSTVVDSIFAANKATKPGGGAIWNDAPNFAVHGSTFSDNVGVSGAALLNSSGLFTLSDSTVTSNGDTSTMEGGGIANGLPINPQATMVIDRSTTSSNSGSAGGGIINAGKLTFSGSTAAGNHARSGGAIWNDYTGRLSVTESVLSGNSSEFGGGIITFGVLDIADSTIFGNSASSEGGGIASFDRVSIAGSRLSDNVATGSNGLGGAIFHYNGPLDVVDSRLTENDALEGGGIFAEAGTTRIADSVLSNNHSSNRGGGARTGTRAIFTLESSTVSSNTSDGHGGGFYNNAGNDPSFPGSMTIRDSTVSGNRSDPLGTGGGNGGAFYNNGRLELIDSTVVDNAAGGSGGGISTNNPGGSAFLTLVRTKVLRNRATVHPASAGGGILSGGGPLTLTDSTVMDNAAGGGGGGGIGTFGGTLTVNRSTFANNSTTGDGGAIRHFGPLSMTNATVTANRASQGGGIWYSGTGGRIVNATVADNFATAGPGIFNAGPVVNLINSIVFGTATVQCIGGIAGTANVTTPGASCAPLSTTGFLPGALGPLADNGGATPTMALTFNVGGAPALLMDAGDTFNCPPTDQRGYGFPRPMDGPADANHDPACDVGAYEWQE